MALNDVPFQKIADTICARIREIHDENDSLTIANGQLRNKLALERETA